MPEEIVELARRAAREAMRSVRETGQQALVEMRRMVGLLRTGDDGRARPTTESRRPRTARHADARRRASVEVTIEGTPSAGLPGVDRRPTASSRRRSRTPASTPGRALTAHVTLRWLRRNSSCRSKTMVEVAGPPWARARARGMRERAATAGTRRRTGPRGGFLVRVRLPVEARRPRPARSTTKHSCAAAFA